MIHIEPSIYLSDEEGILYPCRRAEGIALGAWKAVPTDSTLAFTLTFDALPQQTRLFDIVEDTTAHARCWMGIHSSVRTIRFPSTRPHLEADGKVSAQAQALIRHFSVASLWPPEVSDSIVESYQPQLPYYRDYMAWKWNLTSHELYHLMYRAASSYTHTNTSPAMSRQTVLGGQPVKTRNSTPSKAAESESASSGFFSRLFGRKKKAQPMSPFEHKMLIESRE